MVLDKLDKRLGLHYTRLPPFDFAFVEEDKGGHALNAKCRSGLGVAIDIDFDDHAFIADTRFHFLKNGRHHFTGAAPLGREIDQYGFFGLNKLLK